MSGAGVGAAWIAALVGLAFGRGLGVSIADLLWAFALSWFVWTIALFVAVLIFGAPVHMLLARSGRAAPFLAAAFGATAGAVGFLALMAPLNPPEWPFIWPIAAVGAVSGVVYHRTIKSWAKL